MSKVLKLSSYTFTKGDKFFLDTNIWLYLFCPVGEYKKEIVDKYNEFFFKMLKNKCEIYTSAIILSEFFNTYSRIEFKIKRQENKLKYNDYKRDFRNSYEFEELSKDICDLINNKILKYSYKINDRFDTLTMENILVPNNNYDFNDIYLSELCLKEKIKILTNDKDYLLFKENNLLNKK